MAFSEFQFSTLKIVSSPETWTVETQVNFLKIKENLGMSSRILRVNIANPDNILGGRYSAFQRVRVLDRKSGAIIFLGRIDSITPDHVKQEIKLVCRDYSADLLERSNPVTVYSDNRRSDIVRDVVITDSSGVFGTGSAKSMGAYDVDESNFVELVSRQYGNADDGYESLLESIDTTSEEEPWNSPKVLWWSGRAFGSEAAQVWYEYTAEAWSGNRAMYIPQADISPTSIGNPGTEMRMYIGCEVQFRGLDFALETSSDHDTLVVEYWDSTVPSWVAMPGLTDNTSALESNGTITWSANPGNWIQRVSLGAAPAAENTNTMSANARDDPDAPATILLAPHQDLYWIRISVERTVTTVTPHAIYHINILDTDDLVPFNSKWDYRVEDPKYLIQTGVADTTGTSYSDRTTDSYDSGTSTNFNFLGTDSVGNDIHFYFGSDYPFGGLEFELSTNGNYAGVTFTWEYSRSGGWTTITEDSGYVFSADGYARFNLHRFIDGDQTPTWERRSIRSTADVVSPGPYPRMFWIRVSLNTVAVTTQAVISRIRTASISSFKFFERGSEPWRFDLQGVTNSHGGAADLLVDDEANFTEALVGKRVINTDTNALAFIDIFTNSTTLDLSSNTFLTAGGQNYYIESLHEVGAKADAFVNSNFPWHGLTLQWRGTHAAQTIPIYRYQLGEYPVEFFTRVIVHGRGGQRGSAINSTRETTYGIIKEKVVHDWDLSTNGECIQRAQALLKASEPGSSTGIRRGEIEIYNYPTYTYVSRPIALRVGDIVRVTVSDGFLSLSAVNFLVWGIEYDDGSSLCKITVTQDLVPGLGDSLNSQSQMQNLDKAVRNISWKGAVPSDQTIRALIFHNTEGVYSPEARIVQVNEADDNEDTLDIDNFIGTDTNTNLYTGLGSAENWERAMSIMYARGGALGFAGVTDSEEADILARIGRFYYNTTDGLFKMRTVRGEQTTNTWRWIPTGEWGTVTVAGGAGLATITFDPTTGYNTNPVILLTPIEQTGGDNLGLIAEVQSFTGAAPVTAAVIHVYSSGGGTLSLLQGGGRHNVQVDDSAASSPRLYTSEGGSSEVSVVGSGGAGNAADGTVVAYLILVPGP